MGTRSFIAKKTPSGYKAIYCHWDGYEEKPGVGWTLRKYYNTTAKVNSLLKLGNLSSLNKSIGKKHDFDKDWKKANNYGWTTAYHRDFQYLWKREKPKMFKSLAELKDYANSSWGEYLYVFENGNWRTIRLRGY